ncbi:Cytochrome P450 monooxygenase BOA3 [Fusarium oxysporum f. sp. albedinis]|nr:Cytochrome P450 monooxygenase BOA3 [Fusarium oxysporum f. sp. albedinis]
MGLAALLYIRFETAGGVCRWRLPNTGQVNKERSRDNCPEGKPPIGHFIACKFVDIASLSLQLQSLIYLLKPLHLTFTLESHGRDDEEGKCSNILPSVM